MSDTFSNLIESPFYEKVDNYQCKSEYKDILLNNVKLHRDSLKGKYTLFSSNIFYQVSFLHKDLPKQGWKIHVSATQNNAKDILSKVSNYCLEKNITFKFLKDERILFYSIQKGASRSFSGKFITVYPSNEKEFKNILNDLNQYLKCYNGPYVLTDKRYKDSKVLYYRYGRIRVEQSESPNDRLTLESPEGEKYPDNRQPFYELPPFVEEPFPENDQNENSLLNNRYRVVSAIHMSNSGGVYLADDTIMNKKVILKEARPYLIGREERDSIYYRKREEDFLKLHSTVHYTPNVIDSFYEWEHYFLVVEYIKGSALIGYAGKHSPVLVPPTEKDIIETRIKKASAIIEKIISHVNDLHTKNIVIGDVSANNMLLTKDDDIYIVDFENAYFSYEQSQLVKTPGFSDDSFYKSMDGFCKDKISLGYSIIKLFSNANFIANLDRQTALTIFKGIVKEYGIPQSVLFAVNELINYPASTNLSDLLEIIKYPYKDKYYIKKELNSLRSRLLHNYYDAVDSESTIFKSKEPDAHKLSLMTGDLGVFLSLNDQVVNEELAMSLKKYIIDDNSFFYGRFGLAYALLKLDYLQEAEGILNSFSRDSIDNCSNPFIEKGLSGYGLVLLEFYKRTGQQYYLDLAEHIGEKLIFIAQSIGEDLVWKNHDSSLNSGLFSGNAGVSYYLLKLYKQTNNERYLKIAENNLVYIINKHNSELNRMNIRKMIGEGDFSPYLADGSAGFAKAVLELLKHRKNQLLIDTSRSLLAACKLKFTSNPSMSIGLSGLGLILLDAYKQLGDAEYLNSAVEVFKGIQLFKVDYNRASYYPSTSMLKISTDLLHGEAGILYFLDKLYKELDYQEDHHLNPDNILLYKSSNEIPLLY